MAGKGVMAHFLLEIGYMVFNLVEVQWHSLPVGHRIRLPETK